MKKNFVSKLNKDELLKFLIDNPMYLSDYAKSKEEIEFHTFFKEEDKITASVYDVKYTFTNFNMTTDKIKYLVPHYEKSYLKFMYEKFGEEYKQAFIEHREDLKTKSNERHDLLTAECVKDLKREL